MKTVHGAEFYANKRHKGTPSNQNSSDDGHGGISNASGFDSSPRSEDHQSLIKSDSNSSDNHGYAKSFSDNEKLMNDGVQSIKSESDANSPDNHVYAKTFSVANDDAQKHMNDGLNDEYEYMPSSMVMSTGAPIVESVSAIDDPAWPYEDEDLEVKITFLCFSLTIYLFIDLNN